MTDPHPHAEAKEREIPDVETVLRYLRQYRDGASDTTDRYFMGWAADHLANLISREAFWRSRATKAEGERDEAHSLLMDHMGHITTQMRRAEAAEAQVATLTRQLTEARESLDQLNQDITVMAKHSNELSELRRQAEAQRDGAVKALEEAAKIFREYEASHRNKAEGLEDPENGPWTVREARERRDKERRNREAAEMCERASILAGQEASTLLDVKGEGKLGASVADSAGEEPDGSFASDSQCKSEGGR